MSYSYDDSDLYREYNQRRAITVEELHEMILNMKFETRDLYDGAVTNSKIADFSVDSAKIAQASIGQAHIQEASINTAHIMDLAVSRAKIMEAAIGSAQIDDAAINSAHIGYGVIQNAHIEDASITMAKIKDLEVDSAHIKDASITSAKIGDAQILTAHIAESQIDKAHIIDGAITNAKIANAAISNAKIQDASISSAKIQEGAITTALIETGAIGTAQIADGSITDAKIVELTANKITAGILDVERLRIVGKDSILYEINVNSVGELTASEYTLDGEGITERSITADKIVAKSITAAEIASRSITANEMVVGTITAASGIIADAAINTAQIADAAITNAKIKNIHAEKIDAGIIDAERIRIGASSFFDEGYDPTTKETPQGAQSKANAAESSAKNYAKPAIDTINSTEFDLMGRNYHSSTSLASGTAGKWYRIAKNSGNRAHARVILKDTTSSQHSVAVFEAGINYGRNPYINLTSYGVYASKSFTQVRIVHNSTYDENYLEVYIANNARVQNLEYWITDNIQDSGWVGLDWVAGSVPSGYKTFVRKLDQDEMVQGMLDLWRYPDTTYIDGGNIYANTITANQIATNTITANSGIIANAAITTAMIKDAAITSAKIDSIDAGKIKTGVLEAIDIVGVSIFGSRIESSSSLTNLYIDGGMMRFYKDKGGSWLYDTAITHEGIFTNRTHPDTRNTPYIISSSGGVKLGNEVIVAGFGDAEKAYIGEYDVRFRNDLNLYGELYILNAGKQGRFGSRNTNWFHMQTDASSGFYMYNPLSLPKLTVRGIEDPLWTGERYPTASQTTTPAKLLNECLTGWVLVWQQYNPGSGTSESNFQYTFIHKSHVKYKEGRGIRVPLGLAGTSTDVVNKYLYVYNDRIEGHDVNGDSPANQRALTAVFEF